MKEKELRFALVCFGGVSLAIYMHGISKEILKLVRASSALHAIKDRGLRAGAKFFDGADPARYHFEEMSMGIDVRGGVRARPTTSSSAR